MMGISTQRVKLDINKQASMQVIRLGQGDKNGTTLIAELYDGGSPYSLSGKTARFTMRTPGGRSSYSVNASSTSNNTATFNIDERYAAGVAGTTDVAYIEVLSGSTVICSTSRMRVICLQSATDGVSPSQMHDNGLDAAIAAANTAASSANTAASNANTKASRAETATTNANTARDNANTAASAANTAASAATTAAGSANSAASAATSAKDAANAAATAANTAASSANTATNEANAAIEAMGDISELAVPEMAANVRGGAKVGGSTQVVGGKLEVKLSESATGTSVTTGSTSALRELQVHGKSVQDGTPTPDEPVPVQVIEGANLVNIATATYRQSQSTVQHDNDNITVTATKASGWCYGETSIEGYFEGSFTLSAASSDNSRIGIEAYSNNERIINASGANSATINIPETADRIRILFYARDTSSGSVGDTHTYTDIQLEHGSTATPYVPYGSIGIVVGDTATSIDLQGNTLASLPDGTHDELHVDCVGHVTLEKRMDILTFDGSNMAGWTQQVFNNINFMRYQPGGATPYIALTANNSMCNRLPFIQNITTGIGYANSNVSIRVRYTEDTDSTIAQFTTWLQSNPLTIIVPRNEHQAIDLGYIDPPAIPSGSVVTISASLTPTFQLDCWTEHASEIADTTAKLANEISSLRAQFAALATS